MSADPFAAIATAGAAVTAEVSRIRGRLAALDERAQIAAASPITKDELGQRIDRLIADAAAELRPSLHWLVQPADAGVDELIMYLNGGSRETGSPARPFSLLCHIVPDDVRRWLAAAAESCLPGMPAPMARAARRAAFGKIAAERLALERLEEKLIEQAETAGMVIARRPDADPRAVLGLSDDEL
jgi:hypothetical protein